MNYSRIITQLQENKAVFRQMLKGCEKPEYRWKPQPEKWCIQEAICHLYDEEREDFRLRLKCALETPHLTPPPFDPLKWVAERNYMEQNFEEKLTAFLKERSQSVRWLKSLKQPNWDNQLVFSNGSTRSAKAYLVNWLAHDYLHIRQITRLKYDYLKNISGDSLQYAGNWV